MQRPLSDALSAVLAATGFGVLLWLGISVALASSGAHMAALRAPQTWALIVALVLLATAAAIAIAGMPAPRRPRTLLHTATPWQARRNVLSAVAVVLACVTGVLLSWVSPGASRALVLGLAGMLLSATALGSVAAGAMVPTVHGSPDAAPHPLVLPMHMLASMLTGLALVFALLSGLLAVGEAGGRMLVILLALAVLLLATTLLYRRDAARIARAGMGGRGFLLAAVLVAGVPALALALGASGVGGSTPWLWLVAMATVLGIVIERRTQPAPA